MKNIRAIVTGFIITAVVFALCAYLLWTERDTGFYVSVIFVLVGFAAFFGSLALLVTEKFEKMPWRVPVLGIGRAHMVIALLITAVYAALALGTSLFEKMTGTPLFISMTLYVLIHFVNVAVTAFKVNALIAGADVINQVNDSRHGQATALRALAAEAESLNALAGSLPESVRGEARTLVNKVAEALKYSDPVVPDKLKGIDTPIREGIAALRARMEALASADDIIPLKAAVDKLLAAIRDRNARVKAAK
jgi:hypothetical protein